MSDGWKRDAIGAAIEMSTIGGMLIRLARCHVEGFGDLDPTAIDWLGERLGELYSTLEKALNSAPGAR